MNCHADRLAAVNLAFAQARRLLGMPAVRACRTTDDVPAAQARFDAELPEEMRQWRQEWAQARQHSNE